MSGSPVDGGSPGGPRQGPRGTVMKKRIVVTGVAVVLIAAGCAFAATRIGLWSGAIAQAPRQNAPRAGPVEVVTAIKKGDPGRIEALASAAPIAHVAGKS